MDELPFSSYFWGCQGGSHGFQVFPAPTVTLVCSRLEGRPQIFSAPVKTGLLLTWEERDVCPTDWRLEDGLEVLFKLLFSKKLSTPLNDISLESSGIFFMQLVVKVQYAPSGSISAHLTEKADAIMLLLCDQIC